MSIFLHGSGTGVQAETSLNDGAMCRMRVEHFRANPLVGGLHERALVYGFGPPEADFFMASAVAS